MKKNSGARKWTFRALAVFMACVLVVGYLLMNASQVVIKREDESSAAVDYLIENTEYLNESSFGRAMDLLQARLSPGRALEECYTLASSYIGSKEYDKALTYIDLCIEMIDTSETAVLSSFWLKKGCLLTLTGDDTSAISALNTALDYDPYAYDAKYVKAQIYAEQGRTEAALTELSAYVNATGSMEAKSALGELYLTSAQYDKAAEVFEQLIAEGDNDYHAQFMRGLSRMQLNDLAGAEADFTACADAGVEVASSLYYRGVIRLQHGGYEQAERDFTLAMESDADGALTELNYNRGVSRMAMGEYAKAIDDFTEAISKAPNRLDLYYYRGTCYRALGLNELAESDLARAVGEPIK